MPKHRLQIVWINKKKPRQYLSKQFVCTECEQVADLRGATICAHCGAPTKEGTKKQTLRTATLAYDAAVVLDKLLVERHIAAENGFVRETNAEPVRPMTDDEFDLIQVKHFDRTGRQKPKAAAKSLYACNRL